MKIKILAHRKDLKAVIITFLSVELKKKIPSPTRQSTQLCYSLSRLHAVARHTNKWPQMAWKIIFNEIVSIVVFLIKSGTSRHLSVRSSSLYVWERALKCFSRLCYTCDAEEIVGSKIHFIYFWCKMLFSRQAKPH